MHAQETLEGANKEVVGQPCLLHTPIYWVMQVERLSEMIRNSEATNRVRRQADALTLSVRGCIRKAIFDCPRRERN